MTSERLQVVIGALTSGKFYRLPPDKENPECHAAKYLRLMMIIIVTEINSDASHCHVHCSLICLKLFPL